MASRRSAEADWVQSTHSLSTSQGSQGARTPWPRGCPSRGGPRGVRCRQVERELSYEADMLTVQTRPDPWQILVRVGTSGPVRLAATWPVGGVSWAEQSQAGNGARTLTLPVETGQPAA